MRKSIFTIDTKVQKLGTDYTSGRTGKIIEVGQGHNEGRYRIQWTNDRDGDSIGKNGIKTWCKPNLFNVVS